MIEVRPIGVVRSPALEGRDEAWGEVTAEIHVDPALAAGLLGLDAFSHVVVLTWLDRARFDPATDLQRRPRGRADMPLTGIFAQRAKHRPNPIGLSTVRLLGITGAVVRVHGLDAIDGTPVLDLKPHFAAFDRPEGAHEPAWPAELMRGYFR